jgi:tellurite resistance protein
VKIQTATIRRLRDALLKSGRRAEAVQSSAYETLTRAGLLSDVEQAALERVDPMAETMFLMMSADGKITDSERDAVRGAIRGLTDGILHDGTIKVMLETYRRELETDGREARLRRVGAMLSAHPSEAEGAFALAAAVALADDEVADEEERLVAELATWFGITTARAEQILDQLEDDKAS